MYYKCIMRFGGSYSSVGEDLVLRWTSPRRLLQNIRNHSSYDTASHLTWPAFSYRTFILCLCFSKWWRNEKVNVGIISEYFIPQWPVKINIKTIIYVGKSDFYIWVSVHHKSITYYKPTRCNSGSIVFIKNYKYALHVSDALCVHLQEHHKL